MSNSKNAHSVSQAELAKELGLNLDDLNDLQKPHTSESHSPIPIDRKTQEDFKKDLKRSSNAKNDKEARFIKVQMVLEKILNSSFRIYIDEYGTKFYLRLQKNNLIVPATLNLLTSFAAKKMETYSIYISSRDLKEHIVTWADKTENLETLPPSFSLDPHELTFNRIAIALVEAPTPTFDEFILRCGKNGRALMAFTWSLLEKSDKSHQYLYLKGPGEDGKGSYTRWLGKIFNSQVSGLLTSNKYWPAQCVGTRVGIFSDITNTMIIMRGLPHV